MLDCTFSILAPESLSCERYTRRAPVCNLTCGGRLGSSDLASARLAARSQHQSRSGAGEKPMVLRNIVRVSLPCTGVFRSAYSSSILPGAESTDLAQIREIHRVLTDITPKVHERLVAAE